MKEIKEQESLVGQLQFERAALESLSSKFLEPKRFLEEFEFLFWATKSQEQSGCCLLSIELDSFTLISESMGPFAAQAMLQAAVVCFEKTLRYNDILTFLDGTGFIILLKEGLEKQSVMSHIKRIRHAFEDHLDVLDHPVSSTISVGVCFYESSLRTPNDLLFGVNQARHQAKRRGMGNTVVFEQRSATSVLSLKRLELSKDLRVAIDEDQLELHYQPIVSLSGFSLMGFEALVRWNHPTRGMVSPAEFIPIAEESNLILDLGRWVLREACRQACIWQVRYPNDPPLSISVNFSMKQLLQPNLAATLRALLQEFCLDPRCLKLELTESLMIKDMERVMTTLLQFRVLGVPLSIDDFGTGYSSLSYLQHLPVNTLKIDRSFISEPQPSENHWKIVQTIIHLAHHLGMDVVCEGVENEFQLERLQTLDCEYVQGYFLSKPLPADMVDVLLDEIEHVGYRLIPNTRKLRRGMQSFGLEDATTSLVPSLSEEIASQPLAYSLDSNQIQLAMRINGLASINELSISLGRSLTSVLNDIEDMFSRGLIQLYKRSEEQANILYPVAQQSAPGASLSLVIGSGEVDMNAPESETFAVLSKMPDRFLYTNHTAEYTKIGSVSRMHGVEMRALRQESAFHHAHPAQPSEAFEALDYENGSEFFEPISLTSSQSQVDLNSAYRSRQVMPQAGGMRDQGHASPVPYQQAPTIRYPHPASSSQHLSQTTLGGVPNPPSPIPYRATSVPQAAQRRHNHLSQEQLVATQTEQHRRVSQAHLRAANAEFRQSQHELRQVSARQKHSQASMPHVAPPPVNFRHSQHETRTVSRSAATLPPRRSADDSQSQLRAGRRSAPSLHEQPTVGARRSHHELQGVGAQPRHTEQRLQPHSGGFRSVPGSRRLNITGEHTSVGMHRGSQSSMPSVASHPPTRSQPSLGGVPPQTRRTGAEHQRVNLQETQHGWSKRTADYARIQGSATDSSVSSRMRQRGREQQHFSRSSPPPASQSALPAQERQTADRAQLPPSAVELQRARLRRSAAELMSVRPSSSFPPLSGHGDARPNATRGGRSQESVGFEHTAEYRKVRRPSSGVEPAFLREQNGTNSKERRGLAPSRGGSPSTLRRRPNKP